MNKTGQQVKPTGQAGQRKETGLSRQKRDVWSPCICLGFPGHVLFSRFKNSVGVDFFLICQNAWDLDKSSFIVIPYKFNALEKSL